MSSPTSLHGKARHSRANAQEASQPRSLGGSVLRAGAVASVVSMVVSGVAYAAVVGSQPQAPVAVAGQAAFAMPAVGEPSGAPGGAAVVSYTLTVDGQSAPASASGSSWGAALLEAGVGVDTVAGDTVSVALDEAPVAGAEVVVEHVSVASEVKEDTQPHGTVEEDSAELDKGERKVKTEGVDGVTRSTYTVRSVSGQEVSRELASQVVVSQKVDEVVLVGTRGKQAPASSRAGSGGAPASPVDDDGSLDDDFARLAQCESGGNPKAVNPAGYYGLYQFSLPTWRSVGGTGNPIDASPEEQLMRAKILQARYGWGQWGCPH